MKKAGLRRSYINVGTRLYYCVLLTDSLMLSFIHLLFRCPNSCQAPGLEEAGGAPSIGSTLASSWPSRSFWGEVAQGGGWGGRRKMTSKGELERGEATEALTGCSGTIEGKQMEKVPCGAWSGEKPPRRPQAISGAFCSPLPQHTGGTR